MRRADLWLGALLALLGTAVAWAARGFPAVPGQKVGAGLLPGIVGAALVVCALALVWRSTRAAAAAAADDGQAADARPAERPAERYAPALVIVAACIGYIALADVLGFLIVAPPVLLAVFVALGVRLRSALAWALLGTLVVHLAFYKLLRVPLPWGVLRPWY